MSEIRANKKEPVQRYEFDRFRGEKLFAEGVTVHARSEKEALDRAKGMIEEGERLSLRVIRACPPQFHCEKCWPE